MKILFGLNHNLLAAAGYTRVMSHTYGKQHKQEYITQARWHSNGFPRFHAIKDNGEWSLHYDFFRAGHDGHISDTKSQIVRNERARLKKLSYFLAFKAMERKANKALSSPEGNP